MLYLRYEVPYTEDGSKVFPLDTSDFTITDDDNSFVLRATLDIVNSGSLPPYVSDQLSVPPTEGFSVEGNGTTKLVVEAEGLLRYITTHRMMEDVLRTVSFMTNDQSPEVVRNLSVLVEEFPLGNALPAPTFIPIRVLPVNDRPMLLSSQISEAALTDYLPQDRENPGFDPSFLLSPEDVNDTDSGDFIGLAVINQRADPDLGVWQYRASGDASWTDFRTDISVCDPLFVAPSTRVRFSPAPDMEKEDGTAAITYQAWDGSSSNSQCSSIPEQSM